MRFIDIISQTKKLIFVKSENVNTLKTFVVIFYIFI